MNTILTGSNLGGWSDLWGIHRTTFTGVYKSVDAGASWAVLEGVPTWDVLDLAVDPDDSGVIYAGVTNSFAWSEEGGLYKSTDGGASWSKPLDQPRIGAVVLKPGDPSTVLAFSQPWWNQTTTQVAGVHLSSDGGDSWEIANSDLGHIFVITAAFNPHDPNQILVTTHGGGAWTGTFSQGSCLLSSDRLTLTGAGWSISLTSYYSRQVLERRRDRTGSSTRTI